MIEVSAPTKDSEDTWAECKEQSRGEAASSPRPMRSTYRELFGDILLEDFTFEQKYQKITLELFGDLDGDEDWDFGQNKVLAL